MTRKLWAPIAILFLFGACAGPDSGSDPIDDGKADSGWLSSASFEVDAVVRGTVQADTSIYEWRDLETDPALQMHLIDLQVKYAKNETEARDFRINQLVDSVDSVEVSVEGTIVTLVYVATVDMVMEHRGELPTLDELEDRQFTVHLPLDPTNVYSQAGMSCANDTEHTSGYNYHYYFDPTQPDCDIPIFEAELEVVEVFPRENVYPEYDQLMRQRDDGTVGFDAAIVPARGDDDAMGRFTAHQQMLEGTFGLEGTLSEDGSFTHYEWARDGVMVIIDLYDPTQDYFTTSFQAALGTYDVVYYNGHSAYGTQRLLTNPEAFSDGYQIIGLHSCQSYAYYVQQAFRAKATDEDPTGEALTDFVATGRSSYASDSPDILMVLLRRLMDGIDVIHNGDPESAPSWMTIVTEMNSRVYGINYGVAGVRNNRWQPDAPTPTDILLEESANLARGEQLRFDLDAPAEATSLRFEMIAEGDPDLYVRAGAEPTHSEWDCRPYNGSNQNELCEVTVEGASTYHIMIDGYSDAFFDLTVSFQ